MGVKRLTLQQAEKAVVAAAQAWGIKVKVTGSKWLGQRVPVKGFWSQGEHERTARVYIEDASGRWAQGSKLVTVNTQGGYQVR